MKIGSLSFLQKCYFAIAAVSLLAAIVFQILSIYNIDLQTGVMVGYAVAGTIFFAHALSQLFSYMRKKEKSSQKTSAISQETTLDVLRHEALLRKADQLVASHLPQLKEMPSVFSLPYPENIELLGKLYMGILLNKCRLSLDTFSSDPDADPWKSSEFLSLVDSTFATAYAISFYTSLELNKFYEQEKNDPRPSDQMIKNYECTSTVLMIFYNLCRRKMIKNVDDHSQFQLETNTKEIRKHRLRFFDKGDLEHLRLDYNSAYQTFGKKSKIWKHYFIPDNDIDFKYPDLSPLLNPLNFL